MDKLPISVCILVKNEEKNLPRCLSALANFAEVIVQDTGSTDQSKKVCNEYGVVLTEVAWVSFSHNRNELFKCATQPWVFWLDADEVVTGELVESIAKVLDHISNTIGGFKINRMTHFEDQWVRHGHWFPDWNGRLFRADQWTMPERKVHESIQLKSGEWKKIEQGYLEHYSFVDWQDYKARSARYAKLWAEQKLSEGKNFSNLSAFTHAFWAFFQGYILKKGILDGGLGFKIALGVSSEVYLKYSIAARQEST